jgi:hypothetical protein
MIRGDTTTTVLLRGENFKRMRLER